MNTSNRLPINDFIDQQLNDAQQQAVRTTSGPLLVIAGAGSGKTRVITTRIAYLMDHLGVQAHAIVALTFTNKAAQEMKERIAAFLPHSTLLPFVGTFHAYCVRLLRQNQDKLRYPFFSILDDDDQQKMLTSLIHAKGLHKHVTARHVAYQISQAKNSIVDPTVPLHSFFPNPLTYDLYTAYEQEKKKSKCLDFDDLLVETLFLFRNNPPFKQMYQKTIQHILVDEYQDTNKVQHALLKQMCLDDTTLHVASICVVGDEDQSIYSWRGATVTNILDFQKEFRETRIIKIEQNYRSQQPILETANSLIQHNVQRNPKQLWSNKKGTNCVFTIACLSEYQEADFIGQVAAFYKQYHPARTLALLYRTHAQSRTLEESLIKRGIPYKIIGGIQFYERKEIKDLLAYLRLIINPFDRISFFRIINAPTRGLGTKFEEQARELWDMEPFLSFAQMLHLLLAQTTQPPAKHKTVSSFIDILHGLDSTTQTSDALNQVLQKTAYTTFIKENYDQQETIARLDNIKELQEAIRYAEHHGTLTVADFIETVTLLQEKHTQDKDTSPSVVLMTLHAAKGLEFDTVFIAGLEETIIPSTRSLQTDESFEEERRLLYVGITRAKERIILSHAQHRYIYGQMVNQKPSRFLCELTQKLIHHEDISSHKPYEITSLITAWFSNQPTAHNVHRSGRDSGQSTAAPKAKPIPSSNGNRSSWRVHQPVKHQKYGTGIIRKIEERSDGKIHITVAFKTDTKKILSDFLIQI